jgi:hypothetical protein
MGRRPLADAYERYAALIRAQLDALARGELDALEPLGRTREELSGTIDRLVEADPEGHADPRVRELIERCRADDVHLRHQLARLRAETLNGIRDAGRSREAARAYVGPLPSGSRLDVEL